VSTGTEFMWLRTESSGGHVGKWS